MYTIHGTQKLLTRLKSDPTSPAKPTTILGNWYGNVVPWRTQVAIFVNESTLLPVFVPLAPAKTLLDRFPQQLAAVLKQLYVPKPFIDAELAEMVDAATAKTASRVVVGSMNQFISMADHRRAQQGAGHKPDLVDLSVWLAGVPCGPLRKGRGFPDRELASIVKTHPLPR